MKYTSLALLSLSVGTLFADCVEETCCPDFSCCSSQLDERMANPYLEGYIQSLVDLHYYECRVLVTVKDDVVYLANLPKNGLIAKSIIAFVQNLACVQCVQVRDCLTLDEVKARSQYVQLPRLEGIWFPQSTVLFQPLLADPRQTRYSAAWRAGDEIVGTKAIAVAMGDDFPVFRWRNVFKWCGDLQIGIQAGIWAVFNFDDVEPVRESESCELVNTDYMLSIPLTYAYDCWSYRLRIYHISSHLGDEYLCNHPERCETRVNPSFEAIDWFASWQVSSSLRLYLGPGVVIHSDESFRIDPLYVQYGFEVRLGGCKIPYHGLYGTPFFAVHLANWQEHDWDLDTFVMAGYEWSKLQGLGRHMRVFAQYHKGFSYEGQFFNRRTSYFEFGFIWGF